VRAAYAENEYKGFAIAVIIGIGKVFGYFDKAKVSANFDTTFEEEKKSGIFEVRSDVWI
jgi:hypothetical protein